MSASIFEVLSTSSLTPESKTTLSNKVVGGDAVTIASEILPNGDRATDGKKRLGNVFNLLGLFLQPLNCGSVKDYQQAIEACSQKNTVEQKLKQQSFYYRSNKCLVEDYLTTSQTVPRFVIVTCEE